MTRIFRSGPTPELPHLEEAEGTQAPRTPVPEHPTPKAPTSVPKSGPKFGIAKGAGSWAQRTQQLLSNFKGPIAAVLLGAATVPFTGAALAQSNAPASEFTTPITVPTAASTRSVALPFGALDATSLWSSDLQARLQIIAAQQRQFQAEAPRDPVVQRDLLRLGEVVRRVDRLFQTQASLPPALLADLDHLLNAVADARPGQFGPKLDQAFRTLPSRSYRAPSLDAGSIRSSAIDLPAARPFVGPGRGLEDLFRASPTGFPDQARAVLETYGAIMAGADRSLARLPDFQLRTSTPLAYTSGDATLLIPPGAQLVHRDGLFRIEAPNLLWQQGGLTVVAERGSINLGGSLDGLTAERVNASGAGWSGRLEGATLGISRDRSLGVIQARSADLDFEKGTAHLDDAQLLVGGNGDGRLVARNLRYQDGRYQLDVAGLQAEQTRSGTSATADRLSLDRAGTLIRGEALDLNFGPGGTTIKAAALEIESGRTRFHGTDVELTAQPIAGGGQTLALVGTAFEFENGNNSVGGQGQAQLDLVLDQQGQLRSAELRGEQLSFGTQDGQAQLSSGLIAVQLDERGVLRSLSGRSQESRFTGTNFSLGGTDTRLESTFDSSGRLNKLSTSGAEVAYQGNQGRFQTTDGSLSARFGAGRLLGLEAQAGTAAWQGTDGTSLNAQQSQLSLGFFDDGKLRQAGLQTGALELTLRNGQQLRLTDGQGQVQLRNNGTLEGVDGRASQLQLNDARQKLQLTGLRFGAAFDESGRLSRASGEAAQFRYQNDQGSYLGTGRIQLEAQGVGGELRHLSLRADQAEYQGSVGTLRATQGSLALDLGPGGRLNQARFEARDLAAQGDYGALTLGGQGFLQANWAADGSTLSGIRGHADQLDWSKGQERLSLSNSELSVSLQGDRIASATATVGAGSYEAAFGRLALSGGSQLDLRYADDGAATIEGRAQSLSLAQGGGLLTLEGGRVTGQFNPAGLAQRLELGAEALHFQGTAQGGHPLGIDLANPLATLTALDQGGQRLDFSSGSGTFEVNGHRVSLVGSEALSLATTADGQIDAFSARFPGQLDFQQKDGELSVLTRGLGASYERQGSTLRLDFQETNVALRSEGLTARIEGADALLDDRQLFVRIDRAEVLRTLGEQLDVKVEALTLQMTRGAQGNLQNLDLSLGGLEARVDAMDLMVRTPVGESVRLHFSADAEGRTIKEAFLQIPEGGEVRLNRQDLDLRLGGQRLSFEHGDDGIYRFRGESLDLAATTRSATVAVTGGDAQVSLDPATGRLVIDEIRGTRIDVHSGTDHFQLNIQELERFLVRMTQLEGGATGAALHLVPVDDGSRLTAEIHANLGGVPVQVRVQDAHELKAIGQISLNQVQVYVGDPSGQGEVRIGVGPLQLKGSAVELIGRYHPYDPGRMTNSVHQFLTTDGTKLFSGTSFDSDGVLRLGTDREGLNAELAVLLPSQYALPGYRYELSSEPSAAVGAIGTLGYRQGDVTASLFAGVVPGSHVTLNVNQGTASLGGVPLPDRTDLPTTAIAGLRLDLNEVNGGRLGAIGGVHLNPVGLSNTQYLEENRPYGGFLGLEFQKDNWSLSGSAVIDVNRNGQVELGGAQIRLGIKF